MSFDLGLVLFCLMVYIMVFGIVNMIYKCIETCNLTKQFNEYIDKVGDKKENRDGSDVQV